MGCEIKFIPVKDVPSGREPKSLVCFRNLLIQQRI